jgi:phenylpyruvate tautomerase PptA (4-oxalocrotonate tautomerase family)
MVIGLQIAVLQLLAGFEAFGFAQTPGDPNTTSAKSASDKVAGSAKAASKIALVKSYRIVQEKEGQAVEILSTKPLIPSVQAISDPDRLVIDLPNAKLDAQKKRIRVQADEITALRADQFQENPPVTRVVVDLREPRAYSWDSAGNRLVVHLGKALGAKGSSPFEAPTVPSLTSSPQSAIASVRAAGPLTLVGNETSSGSSVTAGAETAIVKLSSGGEVRVCAGTTVSITPSQNRHNLMIGMNTGAVEAHLNLDASSDSVMTPDFRILLPGPGEFHYAISADNQGNTCVRALPGNTASAIVSELIGDRTYQVKASDQLVFRLGQLDRVDTAASPDCGCPVSRNAPLRAEKDPASDMARASENSGASASQANPAATNPGGSEAATGIPATRAEDSAGSANRRSAEPALAANEIHVQVEAPLVFHAEGPPPTAAVDGEDLPLESRAIPPPALVAPLPPELRPAQVASTAASSTKQQSQHRGFFQRIGGFFASFFH